MEEIVMDGSPSLTEQKWNTRLESAEWIKLDVGLVKGGSAG
jgi:hypothetical protein